ncbi:EamA family transporter RarD [Rodentibacter caecimuris]|uniref:Permease n=1 Tax=Rodentibacter caecimuris TaxID=1796644 RepID=A0ABX3KZK3_9PAST|nr:permease [Rodentibacter heylii]
MLKGITFSLLASFLFGYLYYFSTLLMPLKGTDIFGYRIIFTLPFVALAVVVFKQRLALVQHLKRIQNQPHLSLIFLINGAMMGFQMWLFLWAPNNGSALSVSFGYLLLPIVMVAAARFIFKEKISRLKFIAVIIATIGVCSTILIKGEISWEAIAISFGYTFYFSLRKAFKFTDLGAFFLEMSSLLPICIYFAWQVDIPQIQQSNPHILGLLFILGLLSGIALNAYIAASNFLPMNLLGLLGYVEPILMFGISLLIGEKMDSESYPLFFCLIIAMIFIITDSVLKIKRKKHAV